MGVFDFLTSKMKGEAQPVQIFNTYYSANEFGRVKHFEKLYDYYVGDNDAIIDYMVKKMGKQFSTKTINKMQLPYRNFVRKIVHRISLAYWKPARRYLLDEKENEKYQVLLERSNINVKAKEWNRFANLLDTPYVGVVWREDHVEYIVLPPHRLTVKESPDNYLVPKEVIIQIKDDDLKASFVVWNATENKLLDSQGRPVFNPDNPNNVNPYGVIPYLPCRLHDTEGHWGEGDSQLIEFQEEANILLASSYHNAIFQAHGQPVSINMNQDKDVEIPTGCDVVIQVEKAKDSPFVPPSFTYQHPNPAITDCLNQIDWMAKAVAIDHGLPPSAISTETRDQSGYAKEIDNIELMERRDDDTEALRLFEKKLLKVSLAVWNYHCKAEERIIDGMFGIDFEEIKPIVKSELDTMLAKEEKNKYGLWTPVDDMMDEDEGLSEEKALKIIQHNLDINKQLNLPVADGKNLTVPRGNGQV
jgi:hypothetical protein